MKDPKPRSKADVGIGIPLDYSRIKGRIERLQQCIEKHKARGDNPKSIKKIAECEAAIKAYRGHAVELRDSLTEIAGE